MSNVDFLPTYGLPPLGFLVAGLIVYMMARAGQHRSHHRYTPAE
ncbi:MAG: hypothetical protein P4M09_27035 [Devosia sp.]|nr:hypothetical protein [Devosia sp.]